MLDDPNIWLFTLSGLFSAAVVTWTLTVYPQFFSPSLVAFRKPSVPEFVLFAGCMVILFTGIGSGYMNALQKAAYTILFFLLTICAWTDIRQNIIPNRVLLVGFIYWLILAVFFGFQGMESVYVAVALAAGLLICDFFWNLLTGHSAFGMGDIKLLFLIVLYTGLEGVWLIYISICFGATIAMAGIALRKIGRKSRLPFAPFILAGCTTGLFLLAWDNVWRWLNAF